MKEFVVYDEKINDSELKNLGIFISQSAQVQNGAKLYYNVCILGQSIVYATSIIYNNSVLDNAIIYNDCKIFSSRIENSEIHAGCIIGPFAHIKSNSEIGENSKIGNFVVIDNSTTSSNVKIGALSSINNADIGKSTIIESGVIFEVKDDNRISVGDSVTINSNCNIISPVIIADESIVITGSTINEDVGYKEIAGSKIKRSTAKHTIKM